MNQVKNMSFFKLVVGIALPVIVQNIISSSLGLVDVIMLGNLGETAITAVGVANQYFMIYFFANFGLCSGNQIYLSQYWGDENLENFHRAIGVAVLPGAVLTLAFSLPAILAPHFVLSLFTKDATVISIGAEYLRIAVWAFPFHFVIQLLFVSYRAIGNAKFPMFISSLSLGLNTLLNYLLIFGNAGFPRLEVTGAAIATLSSTVIGCIVMVSVTIFSTNPIKAKISYYFDFGKSFFFKVFSASFPIMLNELFWSAGAALYGAAFSRLSTQAYASYQIYMIVANIVFTFGIGLAIADSITLGNMLGAGETQKAIDTERKFTKATLIVSLLAAALLFVGSNYIVDDRVFKVDRDVAMNAIMMMKVGALFIPVKFYTLLHIVGTLRAGGDTVASVLLDLGTVFLIGVPLAFLSLHVLHLPLHISLAIISCEEVVKLFLVLARVRGRVWVKNLVSPERI